MKQTSKKVFALNKVLQTVVSPRAFELISCLLLIPLRHSNAVSTNLHFIPTISKRNKVITSNKDESND